jgi:hypothetical protein
MHIHSSRMILKRNQLSKISVFEIALFSMAGLSVHNSAKPRPRARRPIYPRYTSHEDSEYVIESQKFLPLSLHSYRMVNSEKISCYFFIHLYQSSFTIIFRKYISSRYQIYFRFLAIFMFLYFKS